MRNSLARTARRLAGVVRRLKADQAGAIPVEVGFPFSAWFFVTTVALTFLDAYVLDGKGIQTYFQMPSEVLATSRALVNL